jgi:hypothetical protein
MKVWVEIPDAKAPVGVKVLRSLSFVKTAKPLSPQAVQLFESLRQAAEEVKRHKQVGRV